MSAEENYIAAIACSVEREKYLAASARSTTQIELLREQRHRDLLWVLDRIATALEQGNRLTEEVVQHT